MKIYFRRGNSVFCQKFGDAHVVAVFRALEIVFYQNERLLRHATNTVKPAIGTALLNRRDLDLSLAETGQSPARLAKKQFRFHTMAFCRIPSALCRARTIQFCNSLREAICAPGQTIVSWRIAPAPM